MTVLGCTRMSLHTQSDKKGERTLGSPLSIKLLVALKASQLASE